MHLMWKRPQFHSLLLESLEKWHFYFPTKKGAILGGAGTVVNIRRRERVAETMKNLPRGGGLSSTSRIFEFPRRKYEQGHMVRREEAVMKTRVQLTSKPLKGDFIGSEC